MADYWDVLDKAPAGTSEGDAYWKSLGGGPTERSALGASAKAGLHYLGATVGEAVSAVTTGPPVQTGGTFPTPGSPFPTKASLIETFKNDPLGYSKVWNGPQYAAARFAEQQAHKADQTLDEMSPEARKLWELEYATLDPAKAAYLSPTRVAGDVLQSAPSNIATIGAVALTRGRLSGTVAGGVLEGGTEGLSQRSQVRAELEKSPLAKWSNVPEFNQLVKDGYHPDQARLALIEKYSTTAAIQSGAVASLAGAIGGHVLGRFAEKGAGVLKRAAVGGLSEVPTEAAQGAEQQFGQNLAAQQTVDPTRPLGKGVTEAAVAGGFVGGISGGLTNAAIGRRVRQDQAAGEQAAVPPPGEPWKADTQEKASIKGKIAQAAYAAGVDPASALVIAAIETGGRFNARTAINPVTQATGLYQFMPGTMKHYGVTQEQLLNDPDLQIAKGMEYMKASQQVLERTLGRKPTPEEMYMAGLFGHSGVVAVLKAGPDERIIDIVSRYDPSLAQATVAQNGLRPDMTRDEVLQHFRRLTQRFLASARGGIPTPDEEALSREAGRLTDHDEFDDMLDKALKPQRPDPALVKRGEEELQRTGQPADDPEMASLIADLQAPPAPTGAPLAQAATERRATLPPDLRGAQPRYGYGAANYVLKFEDDLQKAAYIVARQTKSAAHDRYVQWAMDEHGLTEAELRALGERVKGSLRIQARDDAGQSTELTVRSPDGAARADTTGLVAMGGGMASGAVSGMYSMLWGKLQRGDTTELGKPSNFLLRAKPLVDSGEIQSAEDLQRFANKRADSGLTEGEQQTRARTANRNDKASFGDLPVLGTGGAKLRSVKLKPGQVVVAAHATEAFPMPVLGMLRDTTQALMRWTPNAKVILTAKTLDNQGVSHITPLGNGFYAINPRNLTRVDQTGVANLNQTTQIKQAYSLTHEVGHMIIDEQFREGLPPDVWRAIDKVKGADLIPEQLIGMVPDAEKQAILREYNAVKSRLLAPDATAQQFAEGWLSPWKIGHGIGRADIGKGWHRFFREHVKRQVPKDARTAALALDEDTGILGFHEYAAEQFARYAYNKKLLERTAMGQSNWFQRTFAFLRESFIKSKQDRLIKANKEFQAWLNELTDSPISKGRAAMKVPVEAYAGAHERRYDEDSGIAGPDDPLVAETRAIVEARFPNLPERVRDQVDALLTNGQVEQARELVERDMGKPGIIRWDRDSPLYGRLDEFMQNIDKLPGTKSATRQWLSTGTRRLVDMGNYFTNLQEFAAQDPFDIGTRSIGRHALDYTAATGRAEQRAVEIKDVWNKLKGSQDANMQKLMQEEWRSGQHLADLALDKGKWTFTANERFAQAARAAGLDERTANLYLEVKNEYMRRFTRKQNVIRTGLQRKIDDAIFNGRDAQAAYYTDKMLNLDEAFERARQVPFLPQTRFGEFMLEVRYKEGGEDRIHLEAYESPGARAEGRRKLEKARKGLHIRESQVDATTAILRTLPLEILEESGMAFGLTPQQRADLVRTLDPLTTSPTTRKYSPELGAITGHSRDGLRVFADFMHHDALVTNKMFFRPLFKEDLARIREDIEYANLAGDSDRVATMEQRYRAANGYVQQILNPAHEWHTLRAAVVFNQLGFNIKSAVMNLTAVVNTWAAATSRVGMTRGTIETARSAALGMGDSMARIYQKVTGAPVDGWEAAFSPDERWAMRKAAPFISESFAAQLAQFSHHGALDRMGLPRVRSGMQKVMALSTMPLRMVEEYTRRSTLLTMFNSNRILGMPKEEAFERALQDTILLQGDNSVGGRAPVLRGKKSAFLIYFNYTRGMMYLFGGGYTKARRKLETVGDTPKSRGYTSETVKMWLAYLLLGGLMGEPFAEDFDKIFDQIAKHLFGTRFSLQEHAYELATYVSENAAEIGIDISPRTIVRGMASDFFGMDLSGSVSLGNAIPGAGGIDRLDSKQGQAKALLALLGPLGRPIDQALTDMQRGLPAERPFGFLTPTALQNLIKGMENEPKYFSGGKILADPKTGQITKLSDGELLGQMMGFTPAAVKANQEVHWMQQEMRTYWVERRNGLMRQFYEAQVQQSADAKHDTMLEIQRFNSEAPAGMKMSAESLLRSMTSRQRTAMRDERQIPQERALAPDFARVRELVMGRSP